MRMPLEDRYLMTKEELEQKLAILLAGRASEEVFLTGISTGASDDLDKATGLARAMVTRYGMSDDLGLSTYDKESAPYLSGQLGAPVGFVQSYSEATSQEIDLEVRRLLDRAFDRARKTIKHHSEIVSQGSALLLKQETLTAEELKILWSKHKTEEGQISSSMPIDLGDADVA